MGTLPLKAFYLHDFKNSYIPNILEEIYRDKVYEPFLAGKKDLIIADWGGNIGLTSYYFKDFAKQVYCVEPSSQHLECINAMIAQNKITNIKVCPYAISNNNGKEKFYHNDNVTMFSLEDIVNKKDDFEEVETVTPLEFMKREGIEHIDLCKVDLEGSESKIIVSDEFKVLSTITDIFVGEHHNWTQMSQVQFANVFSDLGFEFTWLKTEAQCFTAVRK